MEHHSTITTMPVHGIKAGDRITLTVRDTRWWRRFLHWALRRPGYPKRSIQRRVLQASTTTLKVEWEALRYVPTASKQGKRNDQ